MQVLFLSKPNDPYADKARQFILTNFPKPSIYLGDWGDELPYDLHYWQGDYIISYLSRWIIPAWLLNRAHKAAINFHPASPHYPGFGCINFALYENAAHYGVTCHHMAVQVDTGPIIAVKYFPVLANDTVTSLIARTYTHQLSLFYDIMSCILTGQALPSSIDQWSRKPFTRRQLNQLETITPDMDPTEIKRRIRATSFQNWQPTINLHGHQFKLNP